MNNTFLNACSNYQQKVCRPIYDIISAGKGLRALLNGLGITKPFELGGGPGPQLANVTFPLPGELSHITDANQLLELIAGLEALELALNTESTYKDKNGDTQNFYPGSAFANFHG